MAIPSLQIIIRFCNEIDTAFHDTCQSTLENARCNSICSINPLGLIKIREEIRNKFFRVRTYIRAFSIKVKTVLKLNLTEIDCMKKCFLKWINFEPIGFNQLWKLELIIVTLIAGLSNSLHNSEGC